jgi:hypothetical protein
MIYNFLIKINQSGRVGNVIRSDHGYADLAAGDANENFVGAVNGLVDLLWLCHPKDRRSCCTRAVSVLLESAVRKLMSAKTGDAIFAEPITRVLPGWMSLTRQRL